jgi:hypothetical protein
MNIFDGGAYDKCLSLKSFEYGAIKLANIMPIYKIARIIIP